VAVYPVPDEYVGDQVMAAIVLRDDAELTPAVFRGVPQGQRDLSPKAWPRYALDRRDLPSTATNKILKRELINQGSRSGGPHGVEAQRHGVLRRGGPRCRPRLRGHWYGSLTSCSDISIVRSCR